MSGRPRFFCEHCGTEVPRTADKCPKCGRFFASVKCPKCSFVGSERLFASGCPVCGYLASPEEIGAARPPARGAENGREARKGFEPLPGWVYLVTFAALAIVVALLIVSP